MTATKRYGSVRRPTPGFSLIELMVTIAVVAIMATIAYPSFTSMINGNRLTSAANELVAALQHARSEAIARNESVVLCPSNDGASCTSGASWTQWITLLKRNRTVLRSTQAGSNVTFQSSSALSGNSNRVEFPADGLARDGTAALLVATLQVCIPTQRPTENARWVTIVSGSRFAIQRGTSHDCAAPDNTPAG